MIIINLTQHKATPEQTAQGVLDLSAEYLANLIAALTFDRLPTAEQIAERAEYIAEIAAMYDLSSNDDSDGVYPNHAMIGGAPYLMAPLERALINRGITPLYSFTLRESVEETLPDGGVKKTAVFKHGGFIEAYQAPCQ